MVEQKIDFPVVLLAHAHLDRIRDFEQRMDAANLTQPHDEIVVKELVTHGPNVNGPARPVFVEGDRRASGVEILGESAEHLAAFWLDNVAPEAGWMQMSGGEHAFESEVVVLPGRQRIEFEDLHSEQIDQIMRKPVLRGDVMFID